MAEGWARALKSDCIEPYSAGVETHGMNPHAIAVMKEAGIDIRAQHSKHVDEVAAIEFDYVVAVCDAAAETCPLFPGKGRLIRHAFDDPPRLAREATSEEEALGHYRRVRDSIREYVASLPESLHHTETTE